MSEWIVMQENLGLGHGGEILITTKERVDANQEPIARNIIDEATAHQIAHYRDCHDDLLEACENLIKHPECVSCRIKAEAAIARAEI